MRHNQSSAINWFEIPVRDLDRAQSFYEALFGAALRREQMGPATTIAIFPYDKSVGGVGGCLFASDRGPQPSDDGAVVYLNAGPSLDKVLARVETAGGRISLARTELPAGMGCFAHISDTEGNRIGLHALS
jgi:uncharacterized protein